MTLLYRSPNVTIDGADWYVAVEQAAGGIPLIRYRFRVAPARLWKSVHQWPGKLPRELYRFFLPYRRHANQAIVGAGATRRVEERASPYEQHRRGREMAQRREAA